MRNKLQTIKQSWTYNHKLLILTLALVVAHIYPLIPLPTVQAEPITYQKAATVEPYTLDDEIERITLELYEQNRHNDLEKYRLEAIGVMNKELQNRVYVSPHIDYEELKTKYGY